MNIHKHARLTFIRRLEMVQDMIERRFTPAAAAVAAGVSEPTARKWLTRYLAHGEAGLRDASSRPHRGPRSIPDGVVLAIVELRRKRLTQARIAQALSVSKATVSRVLGRAGLSRLSAIDPIEPVQRYAHQAPGDLPHIDIKKLARIEATGHRVTNDPRDHIRGAGYELPVCRHRRSFARRLHADAAR